MAGFELPEYLGKAKGEEAVQPSKPAVIKQTPAKQGNAIKLK
jgi:hypothetical protein